MRTLSPLLFVVLLSSASQAKQVVWNGLDHTPEGMANLTVTASGNLLVDNLGSSGCDGVRTAIPPTTMGGQSIVHSIFLEPFGPASPPPGAAVSFSYRGEVAGMLDQEFASFDITWQQGGTLAVDPHFDNLGSSGYDLVMYLNGQVVGTANDLSGAVLSIGGPFINDVETCWVYCGQFNDFEITFTNVVSVFVAGGPGTLVDEVVLLPATPLILPTSFTSTTVRAMNLQSIEFNNELASESIQGADFCNGDGGDQMGCTDCPCGNNAAAGTIGGCLNSASTSARIAATGWPSVSLPVGDAADLRFGATGLPPTAFGVMLSGAGIAPQNMANLCFGMTSGAQSASFDGLRCAVGDIRRHGGRPADANGDIGVTNNPWGGEGGPSIGLAAQGGFAAGQSRFFQLIYRESTMLGCMRGLNTSQAVHISFIP